MISNIYLPSYLSPRNKSLKSNLKGYWQKGKFYLLCSTGDFTQRLLFFQLLKCYTDNIKGLSLKDIFKKPIGTDYTYIKADECRKIVKLYRSSLKRGSIYMVEKEFKIKTIFYYSDKIMKNTLIVNKRPYTQKELFLKALCDDNIRTLNGSEKYFFAKLLKFMENSHGVWLH